jgi:hypothetical protein
MKTNYILYTRQIILSFLVLLFLGQTKSWGQTPYVMSGGDYSETFANIANSTNWPNGFNGTDSEEWVPVIVNTDGSIGDGVRTTVSTATFSTGTSGGVQRGSENIYMLSTSTTNACAIDLLLDFSGRTAGTISFDVATVFNSTGDRDSQLKLFYSTNGTTFTELTGTNLPYTARNNVTSSASITSIPLPSAFDNSSTARLRFYEHSTSGGATPTGSQPKISIDNIAVTSSASCKPSSATSLVFSNITSTTTDLAWTTGDGDRVMVLAKSGSAVDFTPVDGTSYSGGANSAFGTGTEYGTGNYVVYDGAGTSVAVTNLNRETYFYAVYEYNATGNCYTATALRNAQLASSALTEQNFTASTTVADYVDATTPGSTKFTYIGSSGDATVSAANNKLDFTHSADTDNGPSCTYAFARSIDYSPTPDALIIRFDISVSGNDTETNTAALYVGDGTNFTDALSFPANAACFSRIGINHTANPGEFKIRNIATSSSSSVLTGTQRITWVVNSSGATKYYQGPDGSNASIADNKVDIWIGTTNTFNDVAAQTNDISLNKIKFSGWARRLGTTSIDNFLVEPILDAPVANAGTDITPTSFTANWDAVSGATGYRLDVSTSSSFAGFVAGFENLAVSGTSQSVTGLSAGTYYYRVRAEKQFSSDVGSVTSGNSNEITVTISSATDYFRSKAAGPANWNTAVSWESSPDNILWGTSSLVPTSSATEITVQTGHTITINADASASDLTINGTLTFDGAAARAVTVTGDITIGADGTFITQAAGNFTNTMSVTGDISNAGTFDMSRGGTTLVCDVTFNKNGNQTLSGAGATTRFRNIILDMGATKDNILEITTDNFAAPNTFLHTRLNNGTLKLSGTFTYSGQPFNGGQTISANTGIWINNPNVTISIAGTTTLNGLLRITNGIFNAGTASNQRIEFQNGSEIIIEGGELNVASRLVGTGTAQYTQSGGTVTLNTVGNTSSTLSTLSMTSTTSQFNLTGGTLIIRNEADHNDIFDIRIGAQTTSSIGGTIQFGDASTTKAFTRGYRVNSEITLPNLLVYNKELSGVFPTLLFSANATIGGTLTAQANTTVDVNDKTVATTGATTMTGELLISTGTYDANGTFTAAGGAVTFTDAGNLYLANTVTSLGTFTEDVSTVTYDQTGDQNVLGETYHHLVINGSGTKTLGGSIDVNGDLTISAGTLAASTYDITLAGDWTNNGTFTHANRKVTFDGAATQEITDGNPTTFYDLEINNGTNVIISENATVTNVVTFTAGDFITSRSVSPTYLILGTDASVSGVSAASHVNGPMQKLTNTTGSFTFPVGDGTSYRSMAIVPSSTDATTWTAKYTKASYGTLDVEAPLDHVSSLEYWDLDKSGGANATITLSWDANSAVDENWTELVVAHFKTGTSTWESAGNGGGSHTGNATAGTVTSDAWTTFSPFTLASTTANNPLPVTLTYLNAACQEEKVNITWQTASELNADYFAVERSTDGYDWSVLGTVRAGGNSTSTLNYQWLDRNPTRSITSYYRLRQVDFDGVQELYGPISVTCEGNPAVFELEIFPNPAETSATVLVSWNGATEEATLLITDMTGKTASSNTIQLKNGTNLHQIDLTNLSKGIYNFSLIVKGEIQNSEKIIKQ